MHAVNTTIEWNICFPSQDGGRVSLLRHTFCPEDEVPHTTVLWILENSNIDAIEEKYEKYACDSVKVIEGELMLDRGVSLSGNIEKYFFLDDLQKSKVLSHFLRNFLQKEFYPI